MNGSIRLTTTMRSLILLAFALPMVVVHTFAQHYSYLPTACTTDDRFFSLAGGTIQTLGDNHMTFKIASPAYALSIEIGIFDGDTYGAFDQGNVPLLFSLYADPDGDGTGTLKLGEWSGDVMPDNGWYTINQINVPMARYVAGDYFYRLEVRSADPVTFHWSSFKLRTDGTIAAKHATNLSFSAPFGNLADEAVVYPAFPALTPTTYDGSWHFVMDVPVSLSSLAVWDGDFDHGSYDCSDNDTDDEDTPNVVPGWATMSAVAEGTATSTVGCQDAAGNAIGGTTTSNPPDNSRNPLFARGAAVTFDVITPDGTHYANMNPSGNMEWEQFMISTDAFNRSKMDYHADSLPAGVYQVSVSGLDLSNLKAIRFPFDVVGVDSNGIAVDPIRPDYTDGSVSGTIIVEREIAPDPLELDMNVPRVRLAIDDNGDGVIDRLLDETMCDPIDGQYHFEFNGLHPGSYIVLVDPATLPAGTVVVNDSDGAATPNRVKTNLTMSSHSTLSIFSYRVTGGGVLLGALSR